MVPMSLLLVCSAKIFFSDLLGSGHPGELWASHRHASWPTYQLAFHLHRVVCTCKNVCVSSVNTHHE
jgi:hypothetical protein